MNILSISKNILIGSVLGIYGLFAVQKGEEEQALTRFLRSEYGEKSEFPRSFVYDRVDLDKDGNQEYLIGLIGPDFCGTGGCTMLVLSHDLKKIAQFTLVKYPVYMGSDEKDDYTKGYRNIYLRTGQIGYVKLFWNGNTYPRNPSTQPKFPEASIKGKQVFLNAMDAPTFEF
jgi:hypothetical protein